MSARRRCRWRRTLRPHGLSGRSSSRRSSSTSRQSDRTTSRRSRWAFCSSASAPLPSCGRAAAEAGPSGPVVPAVSSTAPRANRQDVAWVGPANSLFRRLADARGCRRRGAGLADGGVCLLARVRGGSAGGRGNSFRACYLVTLRLDRSGFGVFSGCWALGLRGEALC